MARKSWALIAAVALAASSTTLPAQVPPQAGNAELRAMFEADQAARTSGKLIDWEVVGKQDSARRERTRALIDAGELKTGDDYYHAAFIFQHSGTASDYLMAHVLADVAAAKGRDGGQWIAAASLDRYLQHIAQPQIYGTQFNTPESGVTTQEPYDRALLPDSLRREAGVPVLAKQEERRLMFQEQYRQARAQKSAK
jgi:hypothetical protein